jgi:hypothetical protein
MTEIDEYGMECKTGTEYDVLGEARARGHEQPCYYCGETCNALAGNPAKWPLGFPHKEEPGAVKYHHVGCVMDRLDCLETQESVGNSQLDIDADEIVGKLRAAMEYQDGLANMASNLRKSRTDNDFGRLAQLLEDAANLIVLLQYKIAQMKDDNRHAGIERDLQQD